MDKTKIEQARELIWEMDDLNEQIKRVEEADAIYVENPNIQRHYEKLHEVNEGEIKEVLKAYYKAKIEEAEKQFEKLWQ